MKDISETDSEITAGSNPALYVSKSDFKVARECPVKMFYKKSHYPSTMDGDPYLQLLADGGFMVGKMAQLLHPGGITIETLSPQQASAETAEYLKKERVTLFEGAVWVDHLLARFDVLKKDGNCFELIEVKSKGYDPNGDSPSGQFLSQRTGDIRAEWRPYLEDIAFQCHVLQLAYPKVQVHCFLMLPDKTRATKVEGLAGRFSIRRQGRDVKVDYQGEEEELRRDGLLVKVPVDQAVDFLRDEIANAAKEFTTYVKDELRKPTQVIGYHCRECEYRVANEVQRNGFAECWGALAKPKPHLFDLYRLNAVKTGKKDVLADKLIAQGKASLFDVDPSLCTSAYGPRQKIQIEHSKSGTEWVAPELLQLIAKIKYPLHFIDFETSRLAVPSHRGMHPFEQVAFQWSCHTINECGAEPVHKEWINLEQVFPNIEFARTLREAVGDKGTLLTWHTHERTTLREIIDQIERHQPQERDLKNWVGQQVSRPDRIVDLCKMAEEYYFHPAMGGKVSIKFVLPAVWGADPKLHTIPWFQPYHRVEAGLPLNPYKTLPALDIYEKTEVVDEGTGAMRAYQEMLYGESRNNPTIRETWKKLLLQYCCLDTIAMLIIWEHWRSM